MSSSNSAARRAAPVLIGTAGVLLVAVAWEAVKLCVPSQGVSLGGVLVLPRTSDVAMPQLWSIFTRLGEPVTAAPSAPTLATAVAQASVLSLGIAGAGWLIGVVVGFALALVMQRLRVAEFALLPWIVLSQTVPLIALAPLVAGLIGQFQPGGSPLPLWITVALIAGYLAFFPVSVGVLRGLEAPARADVELFRSFAAGWWPTLLHLRLPASVPYLLSALRLAAANAVVGTVVAEVSIGMDGGIGRMMLTYAQSSSGDPAKAFGPILGAVAVGLVAAAVVWALGLALGRFRRQEASS